MVRPTLILSGLCAIFGAHLAAQATQAPGAQPPSAQTLPQALRLTGCLETWDASTMGPPPALTGATSPAALATPFILTNAETAIDASATTPVGTSGQASQAGPRPTHGGHATYLLKPTSAALDLAANVDRQVEITGTLVADAAAATPAATPGSSPAQPPPAARATPQPGQDPRPPAPPAALTVTAVKVVADTCTAK